MLQKDKLRAPGSQCAALPWHLPHIVPPGARRFAGFWVFLFSNALRVCRGWQDGAWALIVLNLCLALTNVRGIVKNERL